jgi:hypothetical protein
MIALSAMGEGSINTINGIRVCAESHAISLFTNDKTCEAMLYFACPCGADVANHSLDGMLLCSV